MLPQLKIFSSISANSQDHLISWCNTSKDTYANYSRQDLGSALLDARVPRNELLVSEMMWSILPRIVTRKQ